MFELNKTMVKKLILTGIFQILIFLVSLSAGSSLCYGQAANAGGGVQDIRQAAARLAELHRQLDQVDKDTAKELENETASKANREPKGEFETTEQYDARIAKAYEVEEKLREKFKRLRDSRRAEVTRRIRDMTKMKFTRPAEARLGRYDADTQVFPLVISAKTDETYQLFVPRAEAKDLKDNFEQAEKMITSSLYLDFDGGVRELMHTVRIAFRGRSYEAGSREMSAEQAMQILYPRYDPASKRAEVEFSAEDAQSGNFSEDEPVYAKAFFAKLYQEGGADKFILLTQGQPEENDCHACGPVIGAAILKKSGSAWQVEVAQKSIGRYGSWGEPYKPSLVKLGPDKYAVFLEWAASGQGHNSGGFYVLTTVNGYFREVLDFETYSDNSNASVAREDFLKSAAKYEFVSRAGSAYYDIRVRTTGTRGVGKGRRAVLRPFVKVDGFRFEGERYVQVPSPTSSLESSEVRT